MEKNYKVNEINKEIIDIKKYINFNNKQHKLLIKYGFIVNTTFNGERNTNNNEKGLCFMD